MSFELAPLPYDYGALEPYIDTQTMQIHHDKHHAAYVTNLNKALESAPIVVDGVMYITGPNQVSALDAARSAKDFATADAIRSAPVASALFLLRTGRPNARS